MSEKSIPDRRSMKGGGEGDSYMTGGTPCRAGQKLSFFAFPGKYLNFFAVTFYANCTEIFPIL